MILARYFVSAILRGYLIVTMALLALFALFAFMEEAGDIGEGAYSARDALLVVAMGLPVTLLDLAPFIVVLGTIFGLAGFLRTQELLAVRAAGQPLLRIAGYAAIAALIALCILIPLEFSARPLLQQGLLYRLSEQSPDGNLLDRNGSWIARGNTFVYVGSLAGGQRPSDISEFVFDEELALSRFLHARDAEILSPDRWRLRNVDLRRIRADGHTREIRSDMDWKPIWYPAPLLREFPLGSLTLPELSQQMAFLEASAAPHAAPALEFWRRLLAPVMILSFAVLGAGLIGAVRPRSSGGLVIVFGIALAIGLYLFFQIGINAGARFGLPPWLAVAAPTAALCVFAGAVLKRTHERPR
ncbi:MAG: LptF/LptG family permease [Pseudomonadales bacterium]|jgi:lipopolysaccharide export system permease protein